MKCLIYFYLVCLVSKKKGELFMNCLNLDIMVIIIHIYYLG